MFEINFSFSLSSPSVYPRSKVITVPISVRLEKNRKKKKITFSSCVRAPLGGYTYTKTSHLSYFYDSSVVIAAADALPREGTSVRK